MAGKRSKTRQPKKEKFLAAYARCGNVGQAAKAAGCERHAYYDWLEKDPEFQDRFDRAHEAACDVLEKEAWRRAVKGTTRPVFQGKEHVGDIQEYSDTLLIFLLKGGRPEKYRERLSVDAKVDSHAKIQVLEDQDWYGNASRLLAARNGSSSPSPAVGGAVQGCALRPAVGKNGHGTNGNGKGPRPS